MSLHLFFIREGCHPDPVRPGDRWDDRGGSVAAAYKANVREMITNRMKSTRIEPTDV